MIEELEKQGLLQTFIEQACDLSEEALADFGRGGKRGFMAFTNATKVKSGEDHQGASFRTSLNARLNGPEELSCGLEEELQRRYPSHLGWSRQAAAGPTAKTIANRITYVTGEILRRLSKVILPPPSN